MLRPMKAGLRFLHSVKCLLLNADEIHDILLVSALSALCLRYCVGLYLSWGSSSPLI